ncbi:MAG: DNA (cytosine-5-)-methyltransferase [Patescibacteria group bacterium]|nr:DNA (cytosine-5-)-methyltransferase [Patescibacteria group bacterium]
MKVASLFCGCGGSDLGLEGGFEYIGKKYSRLPFKVVYALDNDVKAVATYNINFKLPATLASIKDIDPSSIPDHDVLVGGFPCQSFSTVNPNKNPFDERAGLYKDMAKILKIKQPKAFIAENVKGMMTLHKGKIFENVTKEFEKQGYKLNHLLINAADFGIPQKRPRVFIVGIRKDLGFQYQFPQNPVDKDNWVGLRAVIDSLVPSDPRYYFSEKAVIGMRNAKNNMKRGLAQDLESPCLTVTSHLAKVSLNSRDPVLLVDPKKDLYRRFTPLEAARIQSFPDDFKFVGSEADAYRQIGNAIPPVVMWHIAKALSKQLTNS